MQADPQHQLILQFVQQTSSPIFLTGKAGTGKTTLLAKIRSTTKKKYVVIAPTAVAAINAGGVTIHSFFQVPQGPLPPPAQLAPAEFSPKNFSSEKSKIIKALELLIIDEISMVRADTLDYINRTLQFIRGNKLLFGGVQLLMTGDLYQLPPVFQNDWHLLARHYQSPYFFDSISLRNSQLITFELQKVYRQTDQEFIDILAGVRSGSISEKLLERLNGQYLENLDEVELSNYVTLTTHNPLVNQINQQRLDQLKGPSHTFAAQITGDFPKEAHPTLEQLVLKPGAMVMFIKNDSSGKKQYYNGRTARIESIIAEQINLIFLDDHSTFQPTRETWENNKYSISDGEKELSQQTAGTFSQFPLRLAWAITIHKSQGLTFDRAVVDVGAAFAHGQTYVALSRCRTLQGLVLRGKVSQHNIITDPAVSAFMAKSSQFSPEKSDLKKLKLDSEQQLLHNCFDFSSIDSSIQQLSAILGSLDNGAKISLGEQSKALHKMTSKKIYEVSKLFIERELSDYSGLNDQLKLRLKKAAGYFLPQLDQLSKELLSIHQLTENLPFHPDYLPTLNQLMSWILERIAAFKQFEQLYDLEQLKASVSSTSGEYRELNQYVRPAPLLPLSSNPVLFTKLQEWRKLTADNKNISVHQLISEQALIDITAKTPKTLSELAKLKSIGEGKAMQYGSEILSVIRMHNGESPSLF
jgi:PIF1-like helicase/HRDC domain